MCTSNFTSLNRNDTTKKVKISNKYVISYYAKYNIKILLFI